MGVRVGRGVEVARRVAVGEGVGVVVGTGVAVGAGVGVGMAAMVAAIRASTVASRSGVGGCVGMAVGSAARVASRLACTVALRSGVGIAMAVGVEAPIPAAAMPAVIVALMSAVGVGVSVGSAKATAASTVASMSIRSSASDPPPRHATTPIRTAAITRTVTAFISATTGYPTCAALRLATSEIINRDCRNYRASQCVPLKSLRAMAPISAAIRGAGAWNRASVSCGTHVGFAAMLLGRRPNPGFRHVHNANNRHCAGEGFHRGGPEDIDARISGADLSRLDFDGIAGL